MHAYTLCILRYHFLSFEVPQLTGLHAHARAMPSAKLARLRARRSALKNMLKNVAFWLDQLEIEYLYIDIIHY